MSFFTHTVTDKIKKEVETEVGKSYESAVNGVAGVFEKGLDSAIENGLPSADDIIDQVADVASIKFVAKTGAKYLYAALKPVVRRVVGKYSDMQFGSYTEKSERKMEDALKYLNVFLKGYAKSGSLVDSDYLLTKELKEDELTGSDFEKQKKITEFYLSVYELSLKDYAPIRSVENWKGSGSESLDKVAYNLVEARKSLNEAMEYFETAKEHMHANVSSSFGTSVFDTMPTRIREFRETLDGVLNHELFNSQRPSTELKLSDMVKQIEGSNIVQIRLERELKKEIDLSNKTHNVSHYDYIEQDISYGNISKIKDVFNSGLIARGEEFVFDEETKKVALRDPYGVLFMAIKEDRTDVVVALNQLCLQNGMPLNYNKKTYDGLSPIQFSVREGALNSIDCLKDFGADVDVITLSGGNLMHEVGYCNKGALYVDRLVEKLKGYGVSLELSDELLRTPLMASIGLNNPYAAKSIIEHGADVMFENKNKESITSTVNRIIESSINGRAKMIDRIYTRVDDLGSGLVDAVDNEMGKSDLRDYFKRVKEVIRSDSVDLSQTEEAVKRIGDNMKELSSLYNIEESVLFDFKVLSDTVEHVKGYNEQIAFFQEISSGIELKNSSQNVTSAINLSGGNTLGALSAKRAAIKAGLNNSSPEVILSPAKLSMG